jgi:hypothetical protein
VFLQKATLSVTLKPTKHNTFYDNIREPKMFKQQIIGTINIALPLIAIFYNFPALLWSPFGAIAGALLLGIYIWFLNYKQHKAQQKALLYVPSGEHKEMFENLIRSCNIDPATINLRYAYTAQQIAMAMGNTVIMDPTCCSICSDDPNVTPVVSMFTQLYASSLNTLQKERQAYQSQLTPQAQSFIFKHELGHVVDQFAYKKLWIVFAIATVATFAAISTTKLILPFADTALTGILAIVAGLFIGTVIDLVLTYGSNFFFKVAAEKRADLFAAKYSTAQEITDAAYFFGREQEIIEKYKDPKNLLLKLPLTILSGHPAGKTREAYLLKLAEDKK